jgi:hypothetical protein
MSQSSEKLIIVHCGMVMGEVIRGRYKVNKIILVWVRSPYFLPYVFTNLWLELSFYFPKLLFLSFQSLIKREILQ